MLGIPIVLVLGGYRQSDSKVVALQRPVKLIEPVSCAKPEALGLSYVLQALQNLCGCSFRAREPVLLSDVAFPMIHQRKAIDYIANFHHAILCI